MLYEVITIQGKIISPCLYEDVAVTEDGVFVFLDDHTQRKMNEDGTLTKDFVCYNISNLEYYVDSRINDEGEEIAVTKFANLHSYSVTTGYMGLIDNNGRRITPPMYKAIKAVGPDLYRCGYDSVITSYSIHYTKLYDCVLNAVRFKSLKKSCSERNILLTIW